MERLPAVLVTLLAGALVAFQPPANAALGRVVGDLGAAFVSIVISLAIVTVLLLVAGEPSGLKAIGGLRPEHALGGLAGAAVVYISLVAVRALGAGGVAAALLCAQLVVAALIDRFGLLGVPAVELRPLRLAGLALLLAGTLLVTAD